MKRFDHELLPGEEVEMLVTYDLIDAFPGKTEGVGHVVEFETKTVELEVIFHNDGPCLSGEVLRRYGGSVQKGGECRRANNGHRLAVDFSNPPLGAEYILQWQW